MKRFAFVVGLVVLVFAVSIWAQTAVPKPDLEIKKFEAYVGHWTYAGEYMAGPLGPGSKFTGELTIKKVLKGFFFQNQATEKGPMGETQIIEMVGYDPAKKVFISNEYHDDGIMFSGAYDINENICTYTGKVTLEGKQYFVKNILTLSTDMMTLTAKGEFSADGNTWVPWVEAKYTRTTPAPKM
jgi:Protein of unknown function (DUF1579)